MKHLNITIYGKVQGVFFRASAKNEADKLDIHGFAENKPDGSVYIEAEGKKEKLDRFLKWCGKGPTLAKVERVLTSEGEIRNFSGFKFY